MCKGIGHFMHSRPHNRPYQQWWPLPFLLYALLRLPAWFEPHWYTDEAGYSTVAHEVMSGKLLYVNAWNNKPPIMIWAVALTEHLFGTSEASLHLLTFVSGLIALTLAFWFTHRVFGPRTALLVSLATALLIGLPITDAELLVPESLLIAPQALAGVLILLAVTNRLPERVSPAVALVCAGVAVGMEIGLQQTGLADLAAWTIVLVCVSPRPWSWTAGFLGGAGAVTMAWAIPTLYLVGWTRTSFALAKFYIAYTTSALPATRVGTMEHLAGLGLVAGAIIVLALLIRRTFRPDTISPLVALWAIFNLAVPAAAHQPYPHFLTPVIIPTTLLISAVASEFRRIPRWVMTVGVIGFIASGWMARVTGADWVSFTKGSFYGFPYRGLTTYYGGFVALTIHTQTWDEWSSSFDPRSVADQRVATWIRSNGYQGTPAVVWSSDSWLYLVADLPVLLPTPPIYNDFVLLGSPKKVVATIGAMAPRLVITEYDTLQAYPQIRTLLAHRYHVVYRAYPDTVYARDATRPASPNVPSAA